MTVPSRAGALLRDESDHFAVLTGLRGWAALWVYLFHAWSFATQARIVLPIGPLELDLTPLLSIGGAGVSIFFVLSGFLLSLPFAAWQAGDGRRPATGRYLFRRVARVFPAYYVQLAILFLIAWRAGDPRPLDAGIVGRHLLMLFTPPPLGTHPLNGVWWTLPIEFSFYLALPFLATLLRPGRWWVLAVGAMATMALWRHAVVMWWLPAEPIPARVVASYQLPGSMDMFATGMLAAVLHVNRARLPGWLLPRERHEQLGALGLGLLLAATYWLYYDGARYWADNPVFYLWTPAVSLAVAALVLAGLAGSRLVQALFANRFMIVAGLCSYSVYLWHLPILLALQKLERLKTLPGDPLAWLLAASFPLVMVASLLSYLLVERPFMRLRRAPAGR